VVRLCWLLVVLVRVAQHQAVVPLKERVLVDCNRVQIHVRVRALCLVCRAAVVVPYWELFRDFRNTVVSPSFGTEILARPVDPDVRQLTDIRVDWETHETVIHRLVCCDTG